MPRDRPLRPRNTHNVQRAEALYRAPGKRLKCVLLKLTAVASVFSGRATLI